MGPTDDPDPMKLFETLRIVEFDELDTLMTDPEAAVVLCNGVGWTDCGDTYSWTPMDLPEIGDRRVAVQSPTERPAGGSLDLNRGVGPADGDVLVEIMLRETLEGAGDTPTISNEELFRTITTAIERLPDEVKQQQRLPPISHEWADGAGLNPMMGRLCPWGSQVLRRARTRDQWKK